MPDRVGQQLGSYTILQLLGQGGFAEVYLGEHIYLKSQAAVKVLQTRLSGSDDMDSFLKEAQTVARLSHPHIIRVMDFGVEDETPFLVMDYAPNGTLRQQHTRNIPVPLPTIVSYVNQVADALQYAHDELRLIHRDIKPENMLLGRRNEVLLSDFGIAVVAQTSRNQGTQDVIGTVAYMAPEQIQGKPRAASDQYSLGIVVYEWLTGERPFQGSFTEVCTQHIFAKPPLLREKMTQLSPDVEQVVMRALAKDPLQRFENIQAFAHALQQTDQSAQTELMSPTFHSLATSAQTGTGIDSAHPPTGQPSGSPSIPSASQGWGSLPPIYAPSRERIDASLNSPLSTNNPVESGPAYNPHTPMSQRPQATHNAQPDLQGQQKVILPASPTNARPGQFGNPIGNAQPTFAVPNPGSNVPSPTPAQFPPQSALRPGEMQRPQPPFTPPQQQYPGQGNFQQAAHQFPPLAQNYAGPQGPQQQAANQFPPPAQQYAGAQGANQFSAQQQYAPGPATGARPQAHAPAEQPYQARRDAHSSAPPQPEASESPQEDWGMLAAWGQPFIATLVGIVLFCILHNFVFVAFGRTIPFILVVPLFFGAAFGPLVGVLVGLGGVLGSNVIDPILTDPLLVRSAPLRAFLTSIHISSYWWSPLVINGGAGFMAGLSMLTRRRYPGIASSIRGCILGAIGLFGSIGFIFYNVYARIVFPLFLTTGITILLNVGVALALLIVYSVIGRLLDPRVS